MNLHHYTLGLGLLALGVLPLPAETYVFPGSALPGVLSSDQKSATASAREIPDESPRLEPGFYVSYDHHHLHYRFGPYATLQQAIGDKQQLDAARQERLQASPDVYHNSLTGVIRVAPSANDLLRPPARGKADATAKKSSSGTPAKQTASQTAKQPTSASKGSPMSLPLPWPPIPLPTLPPSANPPARQAPSASPPPVSASTAKKPTPQVPAPLTSRPAPPASPAGKPGAAAPTVGVLIQAWLTEQAATAAHQKQIFTHLGNFREATQYNQLKRPGTLLLEVRGPAGSRINLALRQQSTGIFVLHLAGDPTQRGEEFIRTDVILPDGSGQQSTAASGNKPASFRIRLLPEKEFEAEMIRKIAATRANATREQH